MPQLQKELSHIGDPCDSKGPQRNFHTQKNDFRLGITLNKSDKRYKNGRGKKYYFIQMCSRTEPLISLSITVFHRASIFKRSVFAYV